MKHVVIVPDVYDKNTWAHADVPDVCAYIKNEFVVWPETARIYHEQIAHENDVTPGDKFTVARLQALEGTFYVVVYPGHDWVFSTWLAWKGIQATNDWLIKQFLPKQPVAPGSPNNDLAARQNSARINARIPYIVGTVRATPDLIALPYTYYDPASGKEIEHCLMCLGEGHYQIHDCRDGDTDVGDIVGTAVSFYGPNTDITGTPIYQTGAAFTEPPLYTRKSNAINGQTLQAPNDRQLQSSDLYFESPNIIKSRVAIDFTTAFAAGDGLVIYGAQMGVANSNYSGSISVDVNTVTFQTTTDINNPDNYKGLLLTGALVNIGGSVVSLDGQYQVSDLTKAAITGAFEYTATLATPELVNPTWDDITSAHTLTAGVTLNNNIGTIDLDNSYTVSSVTSSQIELVNPVAIDPDWNRIDDLPGGSTIGITADIALDKLSSLWVGWHKMIMPEATAIMVNLNYPEGLYWQSKKGRVDPAYSTVNVQYQMLDSTGTPNGPVLEYNYAIYEKQMNGFGRTLNITLPHAGSFRFRIRRFNPYGDGQAKETVKVKDVYGTAVSTVLNYGNVTIIRSLTTGTEGALAVKERKLTALVTRMFPLNVTGPLTATNSAADAIINMALDEHIGRRTLAEVDYLQIYATMQEISDYFGTDEASQFCYTFDNDSSSFEESVKMIAGAVYCEAYRQGSVLRLSFEKATDDSVLLFNHRNKVPKSEKRAYSFGIQNSYDGVTLEYTDPVDDSRAKLYIPDDMSAKNPQVITTAGIRNKKQAHFAAWRAWNKLRYQHETVNFQALRESDLLVRGDRVLIADNTRQEVQDGEVISQVGLVIETSQVCIFEAGKTYVMHLQLPDGTVDAIAASAGVDDYHVLLDRAPLHALVLSSDRYLKTTYLLVTTEEVAHKAYLLNEKTPAGKVINDVKFINYDSRYYQNDFDFLSYGYNWGDNWGTT